MGFQWWDLTSFEDQALAVGAASAAPSIQAYVDSQLDRYGLTEASLAMVGFSQGTMMALHVGLRRSRQVAAIVGYSGMLTGAATLPDEILSRPPVLLVHGSADEVVPVAALHTATSELQAIGIDVTAHVSDNVGHSVDPVGLRLGGEFLVRAFNASNGTPAPSLA